MVVGSTDGCFLTSNAPDHKRKESSVMSAAYVPVFCILMLGIANRGLLWSTPTMRTHRVALTR
jgi:hypothetical protein